MEYVRFVRWDLLEGIPQDEVQLLLSCARRRSFARGEVVFHEDDPGDSLHLVTSGRFAVHVRTPVGETVTVRVRGPGESFGEMALVQADARRSATVAALEQAETFAIYKDDFENLRHRHPEMDRILIALLAGELRRRNEHLLEALYLPVEKRVLRRLLELGRTYDNGTDTVEILLTQEELAEFVGAARSTVNRVLREEQERGTLELGRGKTRVLDVAALAKRAR
jgi:CRP/FNR family transcriptional regulator, cyclic AMP receptor protein